MRFNRSNCKKPRDQYPSGLLIIIIFWYFEVAETSQLSQFEIHFFISLFFEAFFQMITGHTCIMEFIGIECASIKILQFIRLNVHQLKFCSLLGKKLPRYACIS